MKKSKKIVAILLVLVLASLAFAGCGGDKEGEGDSSKPTYSFKLAAQAAPEYPMVASTQWACDKINELTDGDVEIRVYPNSELGDYISVYDEVMRGTIDMANLTLSDQHNEKMGMNYIPYLVTDYDDLEKVYMPGTNFWEIYSGYHDELGVKLLSIAADGFMGLGASKLDTSNLTDFSASRSEVMRVPPIEIFSTIASDMGYRTTSIAYAELFPALQTGVADGWFGGNSLTNNDAFGDVIKYYADYRYLLEHGGIIINKEIFESMPEEYQQIMQDVFNEMAIKTFNEAKEIDQDGLDKLAENGIEVITFSDEEMASMTKQMRDKTWPKLYDKYGKDVMDKILKDVEGDE